MRSSRNNKRSPESPPTNDDVGWKKWWRKEEEEEGEWEKNWKKWGEGWDDPGWDKNYGWREQDPPPETEDEEKPIVVESDGEVEVEDKPTTTPNDGHDVDDDETWGNWKPLPTPAASSAAATGDDATGDDGPEWIESSDEYPSWGGWKMSGLVDKKTCVLLTSTLVFSQILHP